MTSIDGKGNWADKIKSLESKESIFSDVLVPEWYGVYFIIEEKEKKKCVIHFDLCA